jgi:pimeloyl-ACP methyl ester carboxylesterase
MVNPVLYKLDEAFACWKQIAAPVLWVWGDGRWMRQWLKDDEADMAERRAAFRNLTERTLPDAGHMMHHDQPEALAAALEEFLRG